MMRFLRALAAGGAATLLDLLTLVVLVTGLGVPPRVANVPALVFGGAVQFLLNRGWVFRASRGRPSCPGPLGQLTAFAAVEGIALALNGVLYDLALAAIGPQAGRGILVYTALRFATSHAVFVAWSYPLWHVVFGGRGSRVAGGVTDAPALPGR